MRRRDFLLSGALPFAGLGRRDSPVSSSGLSCILLMLTGGPSHIDTWDPKPDAPAEIRGPFQAIRTNVPGIRISEIFPRMARHAEKYALIRSVYHDSAGLHEEASQAMRGWVTGLAPVELNCGPRYGFGEGCLRARQLVEAGVRFVTVNMFESVFDEPTWDIHGWKPFSPISCYRDVVGPMYDMAYSSLLEDLSRRGLLEKTLVVSMGEFGRTPKINPSGGRDHWPHCFTIMMAGGGIRGGQVYGSSDKFGAAPRDNPVTPAMVTATIYKALGIPFTPCANPVLSALLL